MAKFSRKVRVSCRAVVLGTLALGCTHAGASTIVPPDLSAPETIDAVDTILVGSAQMVGMDVTATFAGPIGSITLPWMSTGVIGQGWSLTAGATDTFSERWNFANGTNSNLLELVLNGFPGQVLFDRDTNLNFGLGTLDSGLGRDFSETPTTSASVTYSRAVELAGSQGPVGDIFYQLSIDFGANGLAGDWTFEQDTDIVLVSSVPEPASLGLLLLGFATAVGLSRRRSNG